MKVLIGLPNFLPVSLMLKVTNRNVGNFFFFGLLFTKTCLYLCVLIYSALEVRFTFIIKNDKYFTYGV